MDDIGPQGPCFLCLMNQLPPLGRWPSRGHKTEGAWLSAHQPSGEINSKLQMNCQIKNNTEHSMARILNGQSGRANARLILGSRKCSPHLGSGNVLLECFSSVSVSQQRTGRELACAGGRQACSRPLEATGALSP